MVSLLGPTFEQILIIELEDALVPKLQQHV